MKRIFALILFVATVAQFVACKTDNMEYTDVDVTKVNNIFEPLNNKAVKLVSSNSATLFFEWEAALAVDGGSPQYEIAFDKVDGDFSNPLYKVVSNNNGFATNAYVTHKVLNSVAALAGISPGESGEVKWTVIASRGIKRVQSDVTRILSITSLEGFADIPVELYVTGEGSEGGTDLSKSPVFKQIEPGVFEIYSKLESGKSYSFVDRKDPNARHFYTEDNAKLKESLDGSQMTSPKTAVYRIVIDFNVATISYTEIKSIGLWFSPENKVLFDLPYQGNGVWSGTGVVRFKQESWGRDERYKFQMETIVNNNNVLEHLGTQNNTDSRPTPSSDPSYYFIRVVPPSQWDNKWKFMEQVDGNSTTIKVILQGDKNYTHEVKVN
jgi:hypothetical protein